MERKIDWYRTPIDKELLRRLTERSDAQGLLRAGSFLLIFAGTVYLSYFFFAELLQHLPDPRVRWVRRYGLYSSCSRGTWLRKPYLVRLAPEGWRQDHTAQDALRIGLADLQCAEASVSSKESRAAWARLIEKVYEVDPLICRRCGSPMRIMAVITEPQQVRKILLHLIKTGKAPPGVGLGLLELNLLTPCQTRIGSSPLALKVPQLGFMIRPMCLYPTVSPCTTDRFSSQSPLPPQEVAGSPVHPPAGSPNRRANGNPGL